MHVPADQQQPRCAHQRVGATAEAALLVLILAASCAGKGGKLEAPSAAEHERLAQEEKGAARTEHFQSHLVGFIRYFPDPPPGCQGSALTSCAPSPTVARFPIPSEPDLTEAAERPWRARQHRKAAEALRGPEQGACSQVSEPDRRISPFRGQRDTRRVDELGPSSAPGPLGSPAGAAIELASAPGLTVETLQRTVDCHLARNAALGWSETELGDCPLNVKGATAKVRAAGGAGGGLVVEVTSTDPAAAIEIVKRARALLPASGAVSATR